VRPKHALQHGAWGAYCVWEHTGAFQVRWTFADEFLACQFAVSVGSQVEPNVYDTF
jgi:hypothetical protein